MGLADYFDFSVYVDARTDDIESWYLNRFRKLRDTAFQNPFSYFRKYTQVSEDEALDYARRSGGTINRPNLVENVAAHARAGHPRPAQGRRPQDPEDLPAQTLTARDLLTPRRARKRRPLARRSRGGPALGQLT